MINFLSQQAATIEMLKKDNEERKAREASQNKTDESTPILGASRLMLTQGPSTPAPDDDDETKTRGPGTATPGRGIAGA